MRHPSLAFVLIVRQATVLAADGTNVYSDNITLTAPQAPPTGCSTSNGTTSSPSVERKVDSSSEEQRPEYEEASEEDTQRATIELSRSHPMEIEEYNHDKVHYYDTVDSNDHSHSSNINSAVQTTHF